MATPSKTPPDRRTWRGLNGLFRRGRLARASLTRRILLISAVWIGTLLVIGGLALDRVISTAITRNFDAQLEYALTAMIASSEIGPMGEVRFTRPLGDQRFSEPYSGLYWQVSAQRQDPFRSRSLWDRALQADLEQHHGEMRAYSSTEFANEPLRIVERDVLLPGATAPFHFQVAARSDTLDEQIRSVRSTMIWSLSVLGLGLMVLAILQATFGLWPLRRISRAIVAVRSGEATRVPTDFPPEIAPLVGEINELLAHNEEQAEAARLHAGNLAHALKTPMSVLMGEARGHAADLPETVLAQVSVMRRHVDHHLARARAIGRRAATGLRTPVWPSLQAIQRSVERIHRDRDVVIDIAGNQALSFRGERQDLEEMLGNLIDNAANYGGGRVFVTVSDVLVGKQLMVRFEIEDDGPGISPADRERLFERGARLDTGRPGTGLGLAIVRDVAEIYGGAVRLEESEDLGGLKAVLDLPATEDGKVQPEAAD